MGESVLVGVGDGGLTLFTVTVTLAGLLVPPVLVQVRVKVVVTVRVPVLTLVPLVALLLFQVLLVGELVWVQDVGELVALNVRVLLLPELIVELPDVPMAMLATGALGLVVTVTVVPLASADSLVALS